MTVPQRNTLPAAASPRGHLRIHQPQDHSSDGGRDTTAASSAGGRHELADVVTKIACRLRQHVASATMHSGMLARRINADPRNMAILGEVVRSVKALETLVDGLGDYAADGVLQFDSIQLAPLLDELLGAFEDQCQRQKVSVERSVPATLCVEADRRRLAAALRHLVQHALTSMPGGGELVITAVATSNGVEIEVADSSPGLSVEELAGPFLPLRGEPGPASGLERSIAQQVATAHGGKATACNCPEGGAALTLFFPARQALRAVA